MADIILSPALEVVFDRIASPVLQRLGEVWDFKDNIKKLQQSLLMVEAVLEDAEEQQLTRKVVKVWLKKLRDAVFDAEDLLEHLAAKGIANYLPMSPNADKLRKTLEYLEMTAIEGLSLNLREGSVFDRQYDERETGSFVVESEVYGREEDREKIVQLLLSCVPTEEGCPVVIPVIGIGGIGKTTVAQLAYNDGRVTQSFDVKIWVFVSKNFDVKRIMRTVIESATKKRCEFTEMDVLQSELWGLLHRKRYLIVFDDVWSEDHVQWEKLWPLLRGGLVGSKIILTTRSKKVAMIMDYPAFPYYLKGLGQDDCWSLFKKRAFQRREENRYPDLVPIGKQIVRKCGGLPLAAKTLGSLMRFKREKREWLSVENSELWSLDECPGGILPSLMLSYYHLPSHLKRCFAFCSIFPKNFEIKKEKLINLWMAEGLILHQSNKALEDIGNQYFNDFLWMSFFQDAEKGNNDNVTGYRMHDIIHDLARYVAREEFMILEQCLVPSSLEQTRHSSVVCKFGSFTVPEALYDAEHLRTLLLIGGGDLQEVPRKLLSKFKYLRALDLNGCGLTKLHESIGDLFCLRYLDLSYTFIKVLPSAIRNLHSLQTLNLCGCCNLEWLPDLSRMANLRNLILTGCNALTSIPFDIEELPQLQTLPVFIVDGYYNGIHHLENINLHGELKIKRLQNVWNPKLASLANLRKKENLELLGLYWEEKDGQEDSDDNLLHILEALQPHQNVTQLLIEGYPGTRLPPWMLPNLIVVKLTNCRKCERLPALGNLALLKTLFLSGLDGLKCIGQEFYGEDIDRPFPSLEELILKGFRNLEEWSTVNDGDAFSKLSKLIVDNCPKLANIPRFRSLQHLELRDCNQAILSIDANLTSLLTLAIERIQELPSISGRLLAGNTVLTSLDIISCPKLRLLPTELGSLTALKSLTIRWCEELMSLPQSLQNLKALESLEISECHSMTSLPYNGLQGLCSLRSLSIENCNNLSSLCSSLRHLTSLEHLTIMYCPSLGSLPEGFQYLSNLRSLTILSCPQFSSLPEELKHVTTLRCLEIHNCSGLKALPDMFENLVSLRSLRISGCHNIRRLPESLTWLSALQHLSIQDCPELEERSKQQSGLDWPKIAHVPHKHIGSPRILKSIAKSSSSRTR